MFNKTYKTIHNNYSKLFKFIFFLRYLIAIFIISAGVFLIVPNFFDYESRSEIIKTHLLKKYNYKIIGYEKIKFQSLPSPRLEFKNVTINFDSFSENINTKNLVIYPKILSIYNFQNFQSDKVILQDNDIILKATNLSIIKKIFLNKKRNKLKINNLNIDLTDQNKTILRLENIKFSNFGYEKNLIKGKVFRKNFEVKINENLSLINFKLLNSGIGADIDLNKENKNELNYGIFKSKILNTNLKFDFSYDNNSIDIINSYFRSKNISFKNNSKIIYDPFFEINSKFIIENLNSQLLKEFKFENLLSLKDFIKKLNSKNEFSFMPKRFNKNLIEEVNLKVDFTYGRMDYLKQLSILGGLFTCKGDLNLLDEYPIIFFDCSVVSENKYNFLRKFSIKTKNNNDQLKLFFKGNLNIINKKIKFNNIFMDKNYKASKEDLQYFKIIFENILLDENLISMFNFKKIKKFLKEIS